MKEKIDLPEGLEYRATQEFRGKRYHMVWAPKDLEHYFWVEGEKSLIPIGDAPWLVVPTYSEEIF
jgi:hypothetical protein